MVRYSTRAAAKKLGIHVVTLQRYIAAKKLPVPESEQVGGSIVRAWTDEDIERVRRVLPTIANGRKTRYKKQLAVSTQQSRQARDRSAKAKGKTKSKKKK